MHEIFGERFVSYRKHPWHNLGIVFENRLPLAEAAKLGRILFNVEKKPLICDGYGLIDQVGLVRQQTDDAKAEFFGVVSPNYPIIQNSQLVDILTPLSEVYPLETLGSLQLGKTTFFVFDMGTMDIHGDRVDDYLLVKETKDGKTSLMVAETPVRAVCKNTIELALAQASMTFRLLHTADLVDKFTLRTQIIAKMGESQRLTESLFNRMAVTHIENETYDTMINSLYPFPVKPEKASLEVQEFERLINQWNIESAEVEMLHDAMGINYDTFNEKQPHVAQTVWAGLQSVIEIEDWQGSNSKTADVSVLFGSRKMAKKRAFEYAVSLTGSVV